MDDIVLLSQKLKEDPQSYQEEYMREVDSLYTLVHLHTPPVKQIMPLVPFVIQHSQLAPHKVFSILTRALEIQDYRLRQSILIGLVIMRQKAQITSSELFHLLLLYASDLKPFHVACTEYLTPGCYEILVEWYRKGNERQKCFCYYFLLHFLANNIVVKSKNDELERIVTDALFSSGKLTKICISYFLNKTEIPFDISKISNGKEIGRKLYREIKESHFDRSTRLLKLQLFVEFKLHFHLKQSVTDLVLKMIDPECDDLKDILNCLVKSVTKDEALEVLDKISEEFMNERSADDVACYGMNVMREIYYRISGINTALYQEESAESVEEDEHIERIKEAILGHIAMYRGDKSKGIHYAYKLLMRAVTMNEVVSKPTDFVRRSTTKEEREAIRKKRTEERKREVAKEKWEKKKKRRGGAKRSKNRLFQKKKPSKR